MNLNPKFKRLINFINEKEILSIISRKEIMKHIYDKSSVPLDTIDTYRAVLTEAGFLSKVKRGTYLIHKKIPEDFTITKAVKQAYKKSIVDRVFSDMEKLNERMIYEEEKNGRIL